MDRFEFALFGAGEEFGGLLPGAGQAARAEVVLPAFEQGGLEFFVQQLLQDRDVLVDELLLQIDRVRGHDRFLLLLQRVDDGGTQVGERFADARAGLDDQVAAVVQGARDGGGHLRLLGAVLEVARAAQRAAGGKHLFHAAHEAFLGVVEIVAAGNHTEAKGSRDRQNSTGRHPPPADGQRCCRTAMPGESQRLEDTSAGNRCSRLSRQICDHVSRRSRRARSSSGVQKETCVIPDSRLVTCEVSSS